MLYHVVQHLEGRIIVLNITLLHTHANTPGSKLSFSRKRICPSRMYRVSPFRNAGCLRKQGIHNAETDQAHQRKENPQQVVDRTDALRVYCARKQSNI